MHKVVINVFEDYRTLMCLRQTASEKGMPMDDVKYDAVKIYLINKANMKKETVEAAMFRGKKLHATLKNVAESKGVLVSQIVEEAFRDYAGITSPITYSAKAQKKGSWLDLNRDVRK